MTPRLSEILSEWMAQDEPAALVSIVSAQGSTPREVGARMLVAARKTAGTIGGGRMEWEAIRATRDVLRQNALGRRLDIPLGPGIGQCCGGYVRLDIQWADEAVAARLREEEQSQRRNWPVVYLFGAGHVGRALAEVFAALPVRLNWVDSRADQFPSAPLASNIVKLVASAPSDQAEAAPPGAAFLIVTHDHGLDFDLAEMILRRGDFAYLGMIGSASKRRRFEKLYLHQGGEARDLERLICPMGAGPRGEKRPEVIAVLIAAEALSCLFAKNSDAMGASQGFVARRGTS